MATFSRLGQSELLPRYIFAESLYARRRVLEIGAVASTLGQSARFLSTRGARVVVAADADLAAVQEAQSHLSTATLRFRPPIFDDFEGGSFDLVIVADLSTYVRAPELLKELARLVAKNGYLMGGLRNPAGLALSSISDPEDADAPPTYGQLLDALTSHFNSIEVATQSPVLGYQIAFERGEGLQVDGSLAGHSEAAYYVVLAGQEPVRNFDPTWVQLPPEPLAFTGGKLEDASRRATEWKDRSTRLKEVLANKTNELTTRDSELREMMAQLESAKDGVSRLTAQLETAREAPESSRERDDLANRVRRIEAELTVARERASDAEGRASAARGELEAFQRAQKEASLQALASQEQVRLERARREEVATQLEDSRNRLATAYEDLRRAQEQSATERIAHERTKSQGSRLSETIAAKEADLEAARQRELRLSDARTEALQAIEGLERSLGQARAQLAELRDASSHRDAERISLERSLDLERSTQASLKADLQREAARAQALEAELAHRTSDLAAMETELQAIQSAQARALRDIETLSTSERTWREIAQQTDQRLVDTTANVQTLSDQLVQAEAERDNATARARRLELDLGTVITNERSVREQTEGALAEATNALKEASGDRDVLILERDDLRGALSDLQKARTSDQTLLDGLTIERNKLTGRVTELEQQLGDTKKRHEDAELEWMAKEELLQGRLTEHITSLAQETSALTAAKAQVTQLEETLKTTGSALDVARRTSEEFEARVAESTEQLTSTRRENSALRSQLETATQALAETSASSQSLQARLTAVTDELDSLRSDLVEARAQFAERDSKLSERRDVLEREKAALEKSYRDLDATAKLAAERSLDLEERVGELTKLLRVEEEERRAERTELEDSAEYFRTELAAEKVQSAEHKAALAKLHAESAAARDEAKRAAQTAAGELATLGQALAAERATAGAAANDNAQKQARIDELNELLKAREERVAALELARAAAADEASQGAVSVRLLEMAKTQLQAEVTRLTELVVSHEARLTQSGAELAAALSGSTEVSARLQAAVAEVEHLKAELDESLDARQTERALLAKTEAEKEAATREGEVLKAAAAEREAELTRLTASLREFEAAKLTVETQAGSLQEQLSSAQSLLASSKSHGAELEKRLDTLAAELEETAGRAKRIDSVLEASKQEHEALVSSLRHELETERASAAKTLELKVQEAEALIAAQKAEGEKSLAERDARVAALELSEAERTRELETVRAEMVTGRSEAERLAARNTEAVDALTAQLNESKAAIGRAQSEARGHQLGKQQNQQEIDRLKEELARAQASLAAAGGETKSIIAARESLEATSQETANRLKVVEEEKARLIMQVQSLTESLAQANADVLEATKPTPASDDSGPLREQVAALTSELSTIRVAASAESMARRQAEDLLLKLRERYGDLQAELVRTGEAMSALRRDTGRTAALAEQVNELQTENVLIEQERERLAQRVDELERAALERNDAPMLGDELDNPTRPYEVPVSSFHVPPLEEPTKPRAPGAPKPRSNTGEFEVFDIDESSSADAEEIVLLEEEATDPNRKRPLKK